MEPAVLEDLPIFPLGKEGNPKVLNPPTWAYRKPQNLLKFLVGAASLEPSELARFCHLQDGAATAPITLKRAE